MAGEYGILFWLHSIIIVGAYLAPLLFNWFLIILGLILYLLQARLFNGCILSVWQFGDRRSFVQYYLQKLGLHPTRDKVDFWFGRVMPAIVIVLTFICQFVFDLGVLIY